MGGEDCGCKKEKDCGCKKEKDCGCKKEKGGEDCGCKKISESSNGNGHGEVKTFSYHGLSLESLQKVKNHEPSHAIVTYLTNINKSVSITMDANKGDIKGISTKDALSELELDEYPIVIDLKSNKPAYDRIEFVASYEDNGVIKKVRRAAGNIIVSIINTRLRKALRQIVMNAKNDTGDSASVITTTIKELIGTSVSVMVDDITGVIENALYLNDANMKKGTFMSIKTYSSVGIDRQDSGSCWCAIEKIIGCCNPNNCSTTCKTCKDQIAC